MAIGRSRDTSDALPNPIGMNQEDSTLEMLFYNIIKNQMRLLPEQWEALSDTDGSMF